MILFGINIAFDYAEGKVKKERSIKSFSIAVIEAVLIIFILACSGVAVKTYTESDQTIEIGLNQEFIIALNSNRTTGYSWQATYDRGMLELVKKTYKLSEAANQGAAGAGGVEYFRFKTLNIGETEIMLVYKQVWRETTPEDKTKVFDVRIGLDSFL